MLISTRGRYALQVMCDLAQQDAREFTPLKEIADRQGISLKYLEAIMTALVRDRLVTASSGRGGGYRLLRPVEAYSVGEILRCTEGSLAPVACVDDSAAQCQRARECCTFSLWQGLSDTINGYLDGVTLRDLLAQPGKDTTHE